MSKRFTEDDFGITHLASMFHQDWRGRGSASDVVASYVAQTSLPYAFALAEDALRLEEAGDDGEVEVLWACATGSYHRLDVDGITGLDWVRVIVDQCNLRLLEVGSPALRAVGRSPYGELSAEVVAEIDAIEADLIEAIDRESWASIPGFVRELRKCATAVCPELAFRVLLRVLMEYSCPIGRVQYERFVNLGGDFSYGEFVVSRIEFLVS